MQELALATGVSTEIPEWWACRSWQRITRKNKYKTEQVKAYSRD